MRFEATIITDAFPPGTCLGPQELRCYNIDKGDPTGEVRKAEQASLVVSFTIQDAAPTPLRGRIVTGSGVFILTFSTYNRLAVHSGTLLRPYDVDLYAANGKTIKTVGLAENVPFQLGGSELETNFVIVDDAVGVRDSLLGRNFLRTYQVLADLIAMKVNVRAPSRPVWYHAHAQVSSEPLTASQGNSSRCCFATFGMQYPMCENTSRQLRISHISKCFDQLPSTDSRSKACDIFGYRWSDGFPLHQSRKSN